MTVRIEKDDKNEEDLYENFVCWATSIISQKTKSNSAAQSRADYLETYVSDLDNGRIELTSERTDLTKEIGTLTDDIEVASQMRTREANDFDLAKNEMQQAIDALTKAIEVLHTATKDHRDGVLMALKAASGVGNAARAKEAASLRHAVELGNRALSKGDALFLRRLLTAEVPKADWKKLNRKATFKMDYKARSFKIQGVLAKMLETVASDLQEATKKETEAIKLYNSLMAAKNNEKTAAVTALQVKEKENGAKGLSKTDATEERGALLTQISDDEGFIAQVRQSLADKKTEWKARQVLRAGELAAISKAVSMLHSDDARDLFKKSFSSQGLFFLQEGLSSGSQSRSQFSSALEVLRSTAHTTHDARVTSIVAVASAGHFDDVLAAIDTMLAVLRSEETSDLQKTEGCEQDRTTDTRTAIKTSRSMDEKTDGITHLESQVAELIAEIEDKENQVVTLQEELNETERQRQEENAEYLVAKKDDQDAASLVKQAKEVISSFYSDNGLMLVQGSQGAKQPFNSQAGEAPPPPPKTWEAPYGGKTEETAGIVAIMEMIHDDILQDIAKADKDEQASVTLFTATKTDLETDMNNLNTAIGELSSSKSTALGDISDLKTNRGDEASSLAAVMGKIRDAEPGCDFLTINIQVRSQNRQIEMDGLNKAKAILSGGRFDGLPDPDREMKPGDAFVQKVGARSKFLGRQ